MQNAQNTNALNEKKNEWTANGKSMVDRAVSEVKNMNPEDIKRTATELTTRVRDVSTEAYDDAVSYIRRNPVSAALGLCAFGFVAGMLTGWAKRSA